MHENLEVTGKVCSIFGGSIETPEGIIDGPATSFVFEEKGTSWRDKPYRFDVKDESLIPVPGEEVTISYDPEAKNESNHFTDWSVK